MWENPNYVSPAAHRSALKKMKAGKYVARVQAKAAYEANRPTEPTYKVDPTDSVFDTTIYDEKEHDINGEGQQAKLSKSSQGRKKKSKLINANAEKKADSDAHVEQIDVAELG